MHFMRSIRREFHYFLSQLEQRVLKIRCIFHLPLCINFAIYYHSPHVLLFEVPEGNHVWFPIIESNKITSEIIICALYPEI